MANQLDRLYYGAKGVLYNKLHFDIFRHKFVKSLPANPVPVQY